MKRTPNCTHACRDGQPCGRKVTDGSQPPVCHIHRAKAEGRSNSPLIPTDDDVEPIRVVRRLVRSGDDRVKLRAVELLLELQRKPKPEAAPASMDALMAVLTEDERTEMLSLADRYRTLRLAVAERHPELLPPYLSPAALVQPGPMPVERPAPPPARIPAPPVPVSLVVDHVVYRDGVEDR